MILRQNCSTEKKELKPNDWLLDFLRYRYWRHWLDWGRIGMRDGQVVFFAQPRAFYVDEFYVALQRTQNIHYIWSLYYFFRACNLMLKNFSLLVIASLSNATLVDGIIAQKKLTYTLNAL